VTEKGKGKEAKAAKNRTSFSLRWRRAPGCRESFKSRRKTGTETREGTSAGIERPQRIKKRLCLIGQKMDREKDTPIGSGRGRRLYGGQIQKKAEKYRSRAPRKAFGKRRACDKVAALPGKRARKKMGIRNWKKYAMEGAESKGPAEVGGGKEKVDGLATKT